jgi:hypothetical protein
MEWMRFDGEYTPVPGQYPSPMGPLEVYNRVQYIPGNEQIKRG